MRRRYTLTLAVVLVVALVGPPAVGAQDGHVTTVDEESPLASPSAAATYEESGTVAGPVGGYDLRLQAASTHEAVGLDGLEYTAAADTMHHYLRIQYNESIERTIRFYVHEDIWHPHYREVDAENADVTASFVPVENSTYTAVEVTLEGQTDAVLQVPKAISGYYYARDTSRSWLENRTGIEIPTVFGGSQPWDRIDPADLSDNDSVALGTNDTDPMLQYDTADSGQRWVPVPSCDDARGDDAPVCTYDRPDDPDHVYVVANGSDPPPVRYKFGTDLVAQARASVNELLEVPDRLLERVDGLFGGDR